jgi:pyridoxine kinase
MALNILSIQSSVAYGHAGNSAAVFPLQRLGVEVWPVNTVHFSNHTGYESWRGLVLPVEAISDVLRGIEERGVLPVCNGVLSGYMGDASLGHAIVGAFHRVKAANPKAVYCCDPVMGDFGRGFFVRPGIPEFMKQVATPTATILTPNQFELEFLAGGSISDLDSVLEAVAKVRLLGPEIVLVTSLRRSDRPADEIEILAVDQSAAYTITTPVLPLNVNGAGDTAAALFFAHWLRTGSTREALQFTVNTVFEVLEATVAAGAREIQLIAAQDAIANPPARFTAQRLPGPVNR